MRTCSRCGRTYAVEFCKDRKRTDKKVSNAMGKIQESFVCECGNVPYRTIDGIEVTDPKRTATAVKHSR